MNNPPHDVKMILEACLVLFEIDFPKNGDSWPICKKTLLSAEFLKRMVEFDKENVSEKTLRKLKEKISHPNFEYERAAKVSKAIAAILLWVKAVYEYC